MKVAILAGGLGSRLAEETETKPKPMIEIGGRPILWHIMKYYAHFGFDDFVIALGYKGEVIKRWVVDYANLMTDLSVSLRDGKITHLGGQSGDVDDWTVLLVDTGQATNTGGRIKRLAPHPGVGNLDGFVDRVARFAEGYRHKVRTWRARVAHVAARRGRSVIWGAGSKGVAFLTALESEAIEYAVDVNPYKHGMYMAGTGQRIVAPSFLQEYRPDVVIAMNPIYLQEIQRDLDSLGVGAELVAV